MYISGFLHLQCNFISSIRQLRYHRTNLDYLNSTLRYRKCWPDFVPEVIAFDIYRVWTQLNMVVLSTNIETQGVQCNFKFWADSNQSAGHRFQKTIPLKLDSEQLGFRVWLQISEENFRKAAKNHSQAQKDKRNKITGNKNTLLARNIYMHSAYIMRV